MLLTQLPLWEESLEFCLSMMMFQPSYMQMFCNNHDLKVLHQRSFICHSCMSQNFVFINNIFGSSCHVACINYKVCSYSVGLSFHATPLPMQQLIWEIILFQSQHGCQHVNLVSTLGVRWHYVTTPPRKILATFSAPMYFRLLQPSQTSYQYKHGFKSAPVC